jgi:hypothetical protein
MGGFFDRKTTEEPQLDNLSLPFVDPGQRLEASSSATRSRGWRRSKWMPALFAPGCESG